MVGAWCLVRLRKRGGGGSTVARIEREDGERVSVTAYRRYPERLELHEIHREQVIGDAPESESLLRARELYELREIGNRRKLSGLTQRDFAELVGVAVGTVRSAERGSRHTQPQIRHWMFQALAKLEKAAAS